MKKRSAKTSDINELMAQVQQQLAVLDRKLDAFMTKSLTELAQVMAASKPAQIVHVPAPSSLAPRPNDQRTGRQMYAVVCFDCGKDTEIPFKPSGDRPVYCKECFTKRKSGQGPSKPNTAPSIQPKEPVAAQVSPAAPKKKTAAKKSVAKKKVAVKKNAKRK